MFIIRAEHEINDVFSTFFLKLKNITFCWKYPCSTQCVVHNTKPLFWYYTAVIGYIKLMILLLLKLPDLTLTYLMFSISLCRSEKGPLWASWTMKLTAAHTSSASCFRLNCMEKKKRKKKTLIEHISSSPTLNSLFQSCVTISLKADSSDQMDLRSTGEWKWGSETIRRYFPEDLM